MTFKKNWEKSDQHFTISRDEIEAMVQQAYPERKFLSHRIISGGCANLNVEITLDGQEQLSILRIYLRDQDAAFREQKLAQLIQATVPVPESYFIGDIGNLRFAITQHMDGHTLRDLLLQGGALNIHEIMREVGLMLARIQSYRFSASGFFDHELTVTRKLSQEDYAHFAKECLLYPTTREKITKSDIAKMRAYFDEYYFLFPQTNENHLVHADYDPANILVTQKRGKWTISAILDWEFAFSGSTLCDVANMTRYAHYMPPEYEEGFLQGLQEGGVTLPKSWRTSVHLLNLLSLLDCLTKCPLQVSPQRCKDICELITYILHSLNDCL